MESRLVVVWVLKTWVVIGRCVLFIKTRRKESQSLGNTKRCATHDDDDDDDDYEGRDDADDDDEKFSHDANARCARERCACVATGREATRARERERRLTNRARGIGGVETT